MQRQDGWTGLGVLMVVISATIGALLAHYIASSFDRTTTPSVQWGFLTVFLLPMSFAIQLWINLNNILEIKGFSDSERHRINETVSEKIREIKIALLFYVLSAIFISFGLLASPLSWNVYYAVTVYTGLSVGVSASSSCIILNEWHRISAFKAKVVQRSSRRQQLKKNLELLGSKSD